MAIHDVVFEMYRPRVEQIVAENVRDNLSRALTLIHLMLDDEMAKVAEPQRQGYLNVQNRMYQTFVKGNVAEPAQSVEQDERQAGQPTQSTPTPKREDLAAIIPFKPVA